MEGEVRVWSSAIRNHSIKYGSSAVSHGANRYLLFLSFYWYKMIISGRERVSDRDHLFIKA